MPIWFRDFSKQKSNITQLPKNLSDENRSRILTSFIWVWVHLRFIYRSGSSWHRIRRKSELSFLSGCVPDSSYPEEPHVTSPSEISISMRPLHLSQHVSAWLGLAFAWTSPKKFAGWRLGPGICTLAGRHAQNYVRKMQWIWSSWQCCLDGSGSQ